MAIILERPLPSGEYKRQFSSCCGACDKGVEGGVVCRGCYDLVEEYVDEDDLDYFYQNQNPDIKDAFFEFMLDDSQNFSEYEQMIINKRRGAK